MSLPPSLTDILKSEVPDPRSQIVAEIAEFLASGALYRVFSYKGDLWSKERHGYSFAFPLKLKLYCADKECLTTQTWQISDGPGIDGSSTMVEKFTSAEFECRNCWRSNVQYFLLVDVNLIGGEITKVGQWPPLSREPDPIVVAGWGKADLVLYRDATTFRNSNKGIGALPYLRRIIENHIHEVLDLIAAANDRKPIANFDSAAFEKSRTSHRFSDKLDFARDYLPSDLTPSGARNPIATLYELISDGLHQRTEEECVDIFDRCKAAFEYVVKKLTEAKRDDEAYIESIRKLT